jgi:CRP/FNR family cyclic AMP-dependent transcriptional regulator
MDGAPPSAGTKGSEGNQWDRRDWPEDSLLGMLSRVARGRLLRRGVQVRYPAPSRILFRQDEQSRYVAVILCGVVKVTGSVPGSPDALLAIRREGDVVGEFAAVDQLPRSATVFTCGTVVAQVIQSPDFLDCLRRDPEISHAVNKSIVAKMRIASARRIDFAGCNMQTRVARVLHQLAVDYGTRDGIRSVIRWPLSQPELASLVGGSPPAVHRVLRWLRDCGVVSTGYRAITVLDLNRLGRMAYGSPEPPADQDAGALRAPAAVGEPRIRYEASWREP